MPGASAACGDPGPRRRASIATDAKDEAKASPLYRKGCDAGDPYGCYALGKLLRDGKTRDLVEAVALLGKACDEFPRSAPGAMACKELADMYREGKGVKRDKAAAAQWQHQYDQSQEGE